MSTEIYMEPHEIWEFFHSHKARCRNELIEIAENTETNYAVCLTEKNERPHFKVFRGHTLEYEEGAVSEADCVDTARKLFTQYLVVCEDKKSNKDVEEDIDDLIYMREDALELAICEFLEVALDNTGCDINILTAEGRETVDDVLDVVLSYLATEYDYEIYRPMIIEDEGQELFVEYPYNPDIEPEILTE